MRLQPCSSPGSCITPLYEATSSLYVVSASNNSVVNLTDLQIGSQLTADYQELMRSRPLLEDVIRRLSLEGMTVEQLEKSIRITNTSDTRILKVTASSPDPQQAAAIANELVVPGPGVPAPDHGDPGAQPGGRGGGPHPEGQPQLPCTTWCWEASWGPLCAAGCWWAAGC